MDEILLIVEDSTLYSDELSSFGGRGRRLNKTLLCSLTSSPSPRRGACGIFSKIYPERLYLCSLVGSPHLGVQTLHTFGVSYGATIVLSLGESQSEQDSKRPGPINMLRDPWVGLIILGFFQEGDGRKNRIQVGFLKLELRAYGLIPYEKGYIDIL